MTAHMVDGRTMADTRIEKMRAFVADHGIAPRLAILTADPDVPTQQFLRIKTRVAERIGIALSVTDLGPLCTNEEAHSALSCALRASDGVVMQLPFPPQIAIDALLAMLPAGADPDCIGREAGALLRSESFRVAPPVVSALREISLAYDVTLRGKRAVVVGQGRLVGAPAALWLEAEGAEVVRFTRDERGLADAVLGADILVLGAGASGLISPDMLKEGVIIYDAGTSEEGGKVVGDALPECSLRASLMTPVPGGIGPLAVAELFGNLLRLKFDYP